MSRIKLLQFFLFLVATGNIYAQRTAADDLFSVNNRIAFAEYLFCAEDYLRAVVEFREVLKSSANDTARFRIGYALNKMNRYREAEDNLKGLFFSSQLSEEARLEFYKSNYFGKDFIDYGDLLEYNNYLPEKYHSVLLKTYHNKLLLQSRSLPDSSTFFSVYNSDEKEELLKFYMMKKRPGYKNETTAALLSAVLPGAGKVYSNETGDGITSFLFTGILTFLAVNNFQNDHKIRGWIFTGLAAYFYAGNIYGSAAAAQNFNAGIKFNFEKEFILFLDGKNHFFPEYNFLCK